MRLALVFLFILYQWSGLAQSPPPSTQEITLVNIGKLNRQQLARQLTLVNKYKPKVVIYDVVFRKDSLEKDLALVKALEQTKHLVMASNLKTLYDQQGYRDTLVMPHSKFRNKASLGYATLRINARDSTINSFIPLTVYRGKLLNSMTLEALKLIDPVKAEKWMEEINEEIEISLSKRLSDFTVIPADPNLKALESSKIKNKIVIFGYLGPDKDEDLHKIETAKGVESTFGAVIHANILLMLMSEKQASK